MPLYECSVTYTQSLMPCKQCRLAFHNGVCVRLVREQAGCASIKQGMDFFFPFVSLHAYICLVHSHYSFHTHTHTCSDQSRPLPACPPHLGHFEKPAVWMINLLRQSARVSMLLHRNYTSAVFRLCVCVRVLKFIPFLLTSPIQHYRRKSLANILIHS